MMTRKCLTEIKQATAFSAYIQYKLFYFIAIKADLNSNQIKCFVILAILRGSVSRVGGAHNHVIAPGQHSFF